MSKLFKLQALQHCEQGTPLGALIFRKGVNYPAERLEGEDGQVFYRVTHPPRVVMVKHEAVTQTDTLVAEHIIRKMIRLEVAKLVPVDDKEAAA